jgi:hypothetical protein
VKRPELYGFAPDPATSVFLGPLLLGLVIESPELTSGYLAHLAKSVEPSELLAAIANLAGLFGMRRRDALIEQPQPHASAHQQSTLVPFVMTPEGGS